VPERSIWSIPIKSEDEHIFASPGLGDHSLLLIQKQDEEEKRCCQRRRIMFVDDELDITFTFKMILEKPKVLFATAYLNYDVLRGYQNNQLREMLVDNGSRFMKKPVYNNELIQRVKYRLLLIAFLIAIFQFSPALIVSLSSQHSSSLYKAFLEIQNLREHS